MRCPYWDKCPYYNSTGSFVDGYLGFECRHCINNPKFKDYYSMKETERR